MAGKVNSHGWHTQFTGRQLLLCFGGGLAALWIGQTVARPNGVSISVTVGVIALLGALGFVSHEKLLIFLLFLRPYLVPLGSLAGPIFQGTFFFLTVDSVIHIFVICYSVLAVIIWRDRLFSHKKYIIALPMLAYLGMMVASIFYSGEVLYSLRTFFRTQWVFFIYFLALVVAPGHQKIDQIIKWLIIASVIQLFWGLTDPFLVSPPLGEPYTRAEATLGHASQFAAYLAMCLYLVAFWQARSGGKIYSSLSSIGYSLTLFVDFILTIARSSWIGMLVSLPFSRKLFGLSWRQLAVILALLVGLVLGTPWLWQRISYRVLTERGNVQGRTLSNGYSLTLFKGSPVWGHGLGSYALFSAVKFSNVLAMEVEETGVTIGNNLHNEYFDILVGQGLIGITLFCILLISVVRLSRKLTASQDPWVAAYGRMLLGMLVFIGVLAYMDSGFLYAGSWFWALVGFGDGIVAQSEKANI